MHSPFTGRNSPGYRFRFHVRSISHRSLYLPLEMRQLPEMQRLLCGESPLHIFNASDIHSARKSFRELRYAYDFPYWAAREYYIRDINDPELIVPLFLNPRQHWIIEIFSNRYFKKMDARYVISKNSRPCGVTTCVQAYILWCQIYRCHNHSNTCTHSDLSIRQLKSNLIRLLEREVIPPGKSIQIHQAGCKSFFNTYRTPHALRGINFAYVHFADMSKFNDPYRVWSPAAFSAATGGVLLDYRTLVVMEGNVPTPDIFRPNDYNFRRDPYALRPEEYHRFCRNPYFLREVVDARDPDTYSLFININLDTIPISP